MLVVIMVMVLMESDGVSGDNGDGVDGDSDGVSGDNGDGVDGDSDGVSGENGDGVHGSIGGDGESVVIVMEVVIRLW